MKARHLVAILTAVLGVGGLTAAGVVAGANVHGTSQSVASNAYAESNPCNGCPAGTRLDSVEVQARQGSTLLILQGAWPSSIDQFHASICLNANGVPLQLKPHGSRNLFEPTVGGAAASSSTAVAQGVATGLQGTALLIDLRGAAQPSVPVVFDVALCNGGAALQRLPHSGELTWNGSGPPRPGGTAPPTPSPTPSLVEGPPAPGVANTCAALPSGTVPPYLQMTGWTSGIQTDPATHASEESVTVMLAGSPVGVPAPFAIVAVIFPANATQSPAFASPLIDNIGTVQLYAWSDGQKRHKALRTFQGGTWTTDDNPSTMHFALASAGTAKLFWTGMHPGDRFGFVSAAPTGCSAAALSSTLMPLGTVA
jgi:hypothetical protein